MIHILDDNTRKFKVRRKSNKGNWDDAERANNTLLEIFLIIAPALINESSSRTIAKEIAFEHVGNDWFNNWPIGDNKTKGIIADFVALDLVEPSKKKHSVNDKEEYWSLTKLGKSLLKRARRIQLEEGIETLEEKTEETD